MTIGERISDLRKKHSLTQQMLAEKMNVSASTVTSWENDRRQVSNNDLVRLAKLFGVSTDHILNGEKIKTVPVPELKLPIAVYGMIHAGDPAWADENIIGTIKVDDELGKKYGKKNLFALKINGDSMSRVIPPNSIAVFAKDVCIENNDVVAVLIDGQNAAIKRYQETSLAVIFSPDSYDSTYQPIIFPKTGEQDFRLLGKMILFQGGEELNI